MRAHLVVGAGYGDEGKGLTVDYLCSQALAEGLKPLVVRTNGGTQAAHTVQTPEGKRHVFNHHGSGGLLGVATHLDYGFLVSPMGFRIERERMDFAPGPVTVDPRCDVALPVDMLLNQMMEQLRGGSKHGSCGWGIGETVERSTDPDTRLVYADLLSGLLGVTEIYNITKRYLEVRLPKLRAGLEVPQEWHERIHDGRIIEQWLADAEFLVQHTEPRLPSLATGGYDILVLEGAQGLGLDQDGEHFPHVTRSKTGSPNMLEFLRLAGVGADDDVDATYVTRCYATRHGAGPLEHEGLPHGCNVDDPTNSPNQWQGTLRSAPLDMDLTAKRITADAVGVLRQFPQAKVTFVMTCLDQAGPDYAYVADDGGLVPPDASPDLLVGRLMGAVDIGLRLPHRLQWTATRILTSSGPTRKDVSCTLELHGTLMERLSYAVQRQAEMETAH